MIRSDNALPRAPKVMFYQKVSYALSCWMASVRSPTAAAFLLKHLVQVNQSLKTYPPISDHLSTIFGKVRAHPVT